MSKFLPESEREREKEKIKTLEEIRPEKVQTIAEGIGERAD